ncbi:MAG: hypothetical protein NVS3B21_14280 [Acidimicrobiales bacterium]
MGRGARVVGALCVIIVLVAATVVSIRASYGAYKGGYQLIGTFDRAAYGFGPSTEVDYLGIDVGHVTRTRLRADHRLDASLKVNEGFKVPVGTVAKVHNRSLFGDPYIDLVFPPGAATRYLAKGSHLDVTSVDADTGDLIRSATPLFEHINGQDLLTLVREIDQASRGEGDKVAQSIRDGAQLSALYANTIDAQLRALDSFTAFQVAVTPDAGEINNLSAIGNRSLPTLNAAEKDFQTALLTVGPFADKLANVIAQERPNIDQLLARGDNVVRLLAMRQPQIEQVISGLALYLQKFAQGPGPETLPNGTKFVYFKNFIEFSDLSRLICGLIASPTGGGPAPSQLQPLIAAVGSAGLGCKQPPAAAPGPAPAGPPAQRTAPPAVPAVPAPSPANDLLQHVAGQIGAPQPTRPATVQDMVQRILGGP